VVLSPGRKQWDLGALSLATASEPGDGPLNAYLLPLATASATWRRPAHPLSLTAAASTTAIMLNPGDKVVIVLVKRAFTLFSSKLSEDHHMPCGIKSL